MIDFLDIAVSLYTNSLTLFVGTGFSKYITKGAAPSWLELIVEATRRIDEDDLLLHQLFNVDEDNNVTNSIYELTVCAQIIEAEYKKNDKNLKVEISEIIKSKVNKKTIDRERLEEVQNFFSKHPNINIITTNYDTIFSDYIIPLTSRVIIEGSTIPRINSGQNIYHIHGIVNKPNSLVLTLNDYYKFQNSNNYFSRKFFTLLQETTVVISGYSLGDFNLNTILNEVNNLKKGSIRNADIYYATKDSVSEIMSTFYSHTYGIKVIDKKSISKLLSFIDAEYDKAKELIDSVKDLTGVMEGKLVYTDDFLKLKVSLSTILLQAASLGIESDNVDFLKVVASALEQKRLLTRENNAWSQYEHLADWLIDIACIINIKGSPIETEYCKIAEYSFSYSSRESYKGYSWYAWREWKNKWKEMKLENQSMLRTIIDNNHWSSIQDTQNLYK